MKNNTDIKQVWSKQPVPAADLSEIVRKTGDYKRKRIKNLLIINTILLLTIFFVVFVWIYFKPQLPGTKIGIILTILPMSMVFLFNRRLIPLYKKIDENQSNLDYLKDLLVLKSKENLLQTKIMNVYFLLLSVGICLYIYEYTLYRSVLFGITAYFITLAWIGFNFFYLRPGIIRKNNHKTNELISRIQIIKSQLNKNE